MTALKKTIRKWLEQGVEQEATHVIVVCDTFEPDDYPVFVLPEQDVREVVKEYGMMQMQKVIEVYNLSMSIEEQLASTLVYNI